MFARPCCVFPVVLAALVLWMSGVHAQSTEGEIRTRLVDHTLFLHGAWVEDKLKFDANGQPEKDHKTGPPSVCGSRAKDVELRGDHLRITGVRVGFTCSGNVSVHLVVDAQGLPVRVRVARPVGLGLDEQALAAVSRYRFAPAMQDGHPVPIELTVEVNCQVF